MDTASYLTTLLADFTAAEWQEAHDWLACPVHNQRAEVLRLFATLRTHWAQKKDWPSAQEAFSAAQPDSVFTPARWAKLQHYLYHCLEEWLAYRLFRSTYAADVHLLAAYRERGLERHLRHRLQTLQSAARRAPADASLARLRYDYTLLREHYRLETTNNRQPRTHIAQPEAALLRALVAEKLQQACETLARLRLLPGDDYQIPLLSEVMSEARRLAPTVTGIRLFYLACQLYAPVEGQDAIFRQLKTELLAHLAEFSVAEQRNLLILAINFGLRRSNAGQQTYLQETLDLYRLGLARGLLVEHGRISIFTFNNIIGIALRLGEVDWAAQFLESHVRYLPPTHRQEVESLNRARLAYQTGDYSATLQWLQTADYRDFIHHMTARVLQLKVFMERNNYNLTLSHIRATRTLLRRRRNVGYHQQNYLNIFGLAERIVRLPPGDDAAVQKLAAAIEQTEPCTERAWLLGRLFD